MVAWWIRHHTTCYCSYIWPQDMRAGVCSLLCRHQLALSLPGFIPWSACPVSLPAASLPNSEGIKWEVAFSPGNCKFISTATKSMWAAQLGMCYMPDLFSAAVLHLTSCLWQCCCYKSWSCSWETCELPIMTAELQQVEQARLDLHVSASLFLSDLHVWHNSLPWLCWQQSSYHCQKAFPIWLI